MPHNDLTDPNALTGECIGEVHTPPVAPLPTSHTSPRMHFFGFGKSIRQPEKRHNLNPELLSCWRTQETVC